MAKFVPDVKTQRWIIISPVRTGKPDENVTVVRPRICPFCSGNEKETPPEIMRIGDGEKDAKGWHIRVIPNKYPITDTHEVVIHSPDHVKNIEDFSLDHVNNLFRIYRSRFAVHQEDGHVMVFSNYGENAGASLKHPHSQIVVIPRQINLDALIREPIQNTIEDNTYFVTYCPDFSQWPYEMWISPKKEKTLFSDISDEEMKDLSELFQKMIRKLKVISAKPEVQKLRGGAGFNYNFYIHHDKDWFIRIIPRFIHRAGFELGTGLNVNIIDPTEAANELKEIKV